MLLSNLVNSICIISIIRLRALVDWTTQDGTYFNSRAILWTSLESSLGIICACIVVIRPLFGVPKSQARLSSLNPQKLSGSPVLWAPSWVRLAQKNRLGMDSAPRQAESEEDLGRRGDFRK